MEADMDDPIVVVPYNPAWKTEFSEMGWKLRNAIGDIAHRIHHIGSTSIEGMDAKPIVDIQISVQSMEPMNLYKSKLEEIGLIYQSNNPDLTKRFFREAPGAKRMHIHVRELGSWAEQFNLLFRDYLRENPGDCRKYAELKIKLMELFRHDRESYVEGKGPVIWEIMTRANQWSQDTGWKVGESDI
jgi:GrpB-like predicted nucleotidyltransferase (UPF0157 family)